MADFTVDVPIGEGGSSSSAGASSNKDQKETNRLLKKLDKSIIATLDIGEVITQLFAGLIKALQPLIQILSVLFFIVFMPLLPLIADLTKVVGEFTSGLARLFRGKINLEDFIKSYLGPALASIGLLLVNGLIDIVKGFIEFFFAIGTVIGDAISEYVITPLINSITWVVQGIIDGFSRLFDYVADLGILIWTYLIKPPFQFLSNVGQWIWDQFIRPPFEFLLNVGRWIWEIISSPFRWLADKIRSILDFFSFGSGKSKSVNDAIITPQGVINTHPDDYIIATKDPSSLGGKSIVVNINNPTVRSKSDIKDIADQVSKVLQRQLPRRVSSG